MRRRFSPLVRVLLGGWLLLLVWAAWGVFGTFTVVRPSFAVLERHDGYEVRAYGPQQVAQLAVSAPGQSALNDAVGVLQAYIRGDNLTPAGAGYARVRIADRAPVMLSERGTTTSVSLILPPGPTADEVPRPNHPEIRIVQLPDATLAVRSFVGRTDLDRFHSEASRLAALLAHDGRAIVSSDIWYVRYDPPLTPPFMRHGDVMVGVHRAP